MTHPRTERRLREASADMAAAVALALGEGPGELAWVQNRGQVYARRAEPLGPRTAIIDLIETVREQWPDDADFILRNRIYTTAGFSELDDGAVKVGARRWTYGVVASGAPEPCASVVDVGPIVAEAAGRCAGLVELPQHACARREAERMAASAETRDQRYRSDHAVGAVLVGGDGTLLLSARNGSGGNRTHHAEFCLAQTWWRREGRSLPPGAHLLVTLQPCRMCAAALVSIAPEGGLRVGYRDPDPGRLARCTALDARGWLHRVPDWSG